MKILHLPLTLKYYNLQENESIVHPTIIWDYGL
jgi:hypothetical protein